MAGMSARDWIVFALLGAALWLLLHPLGWAAFIPLVFACLFWRLVLPPLFHWIAEGERRD